MSTLDREPEHGHFNRATVLVAAVFTALVTLLATVLALGAGHMAAAFVLAAGTVIVGLMVRGAVGRQAMWMCFGLAALAVAVGAVLQLMASAL